MTDPTSTSGAAGLALGGPNVVALGGGHGQAVTLRAARCFAGELTAVVSVADDGGSSGRLRRQLGIIPPGDLRMCLEALADPDSVLARAFEHRFEADDLFESAGQNGEVGHAVGNLVLAALVAVTGDIQSALDHAGDLLGAVGRVVPAATEPVVLKAQTGSGEIHGQSAVVRTPSIRRVSLVPEDVCASKLAMSCIENADQVVLGPGSLFTSVLAAALVPGISQALSRTKAKRVYVANLRPQAAETEGYDVAAHLRALIVHGVEVDAVVVDSSSICVGDLALATKPMGRDLEVLDRPMARSDGVAHDPDRLADALRSLL